MNYTQYENEYTNAKLENSYFYSGEQNQPEDDEQITMEQMKKEFYEEQRQMDAELEEMDQTLDDLTLGEWTLGEWLKATDEQFKKEVEEYNRIQAKLDKEREARKPTEAEIQEEQQKFFDDCKKDKLKQQRQNERYEKWIEEYYNSHPNTTIKLDDPLNVQIRKMLAELEVEKKQQAELERKRAIKRSNRLMIRQEQTRRKKSRERKAKQFSKLNAQGKFQGVKKEVEQKPKGSRAKRREKEITIVLAEKKEQIVVQDYIKSGAYAKQFNQAGYGLKGNCEYPVINEEENEEQDEEEMPIITSTSTIFNLNTKVTKTKAKNNTKIEEELFSSLGISTKKIFTKKIEKKNKKKTTSIIVGKSYRQEMQDKRPTHNTTKTVMCKSVASNKKCYHGKNCRFAHTIDELNVIECRFGHRCRVYETCKFMHPESETKKEYLIRTGVIKVNKPVKQTAKQQPKKVYKAPVAPWAKKNNKLSEQKPRKTRWDQKPTNKPRKSRWD